ncbi:hypothetical protein F5Y07DRAFT_329438 [Xylaria sp. FL0933]|nr:hypothetical protein F5Y07DRAFT_329438 [Xylaria sp. FL0933]
MGLLSRWVTGRSARHSVIFIPSSPFLRYDHLLVLMSSLTLWCPSSWMRGYYSTCSKNPHLDRVWFGLVRWRIASSNTNASVMGEVAFDYHHFCPPATSLIPWHRSASSSSSPFFFSFSPFSFHRFFFTIPIPFLSVPLLMPPLLLWLPVTVFHSLNPSVPIYWDVPGRLMQDVDCVSGYGSRSYLSLARTYVAEPRLLLFLRKKHCIPRFSVPRRCFASTLVSQPVGNQGVGDCMLSCNLDYVARGESE